MEGTLINLTVLRFSPPIVPKGTKDKRNYKSLSIRMLVSALGVTLAPLVIDILLLYPSNAFKDINRYIVRNFYSELETRPRAEYAVARLLTNNRIF